MGHLISLAKENQSSEFKILLNTYIYIYKYILLVVQSGFILCIAVVSPGIHIGLMLIYPSRYGYHQNTAVLLRWCTHPQRRW